MDAAPLTSAHTHARAAAVETHKSNLPAAQTNHELAAGDFVSAQSTTTDPEALRILHLLETHHRQLAQLLNTQPTAPSEPIKSTPSSAAPTPTLTPHTSDTPRIDSPPKQPPSLTRQSSSLLRSRPLSSSIATNLAAVRGKPGTQRRPPPILPSVTPHHASAIPPTRPQPPTQQQAPSSEADASFNRFFATFESLVSKLSAPLAFTGLPLTEPASDPHKRSDEPDLTAIYSKPALRALRADGAVGPTLGPHESFYVVPPSGGTISYAGIVAGRDHETHKGGFDTIEEDADEFVDAHETPHPSSPTSLRNSSSRPREANSRNLKDRKDGSGARSEKRKDSSATTPKTATGKTMEELELENTALRQTLDAQSRRLHMWEASSQSQSAALARSFRIAGRTEDGLSPDADALRRVAELEAQLTREKAEMEAAAAKAEKIARENERLQSMLGKYREKWEMLKAGARERERAKG
ncbi:hypothetical protein EJ06DRAFT_467441, partial [Trichodelitschia bisporula]